MTTHIEINRGTCKACGLCVEICPMGIPHLVPQPADGAEIELPPDRLHTCMGCGHCMAICPTRSIRVDGLSYEEHFFDLPQGDRDADLFFDLIASRRSVRVFKDKPVPREALQKIVDTMCLAPMGYTPSKVEVTVVRSRETIEQSLPLMVRLYGGLMQRMDSPVSRFFVKRMASPEAFTALNEHVMPSFKFRLPEMKAGRGDTITRGAPAMFLFHAHRESGAHTDDAIICLTYGLLAAHALGLGATALSLVPAAVERMPELRTMFHIPPDNEVLASMIVGYPKYRFKRGIRRKLANVRWL